MEYQIKTEPHNLCIKNRDISICPCCQTELEHVIKSGKYCNECGYCRYGDRPFGMCGNSREGIYPEGCTCEYGEKDFLFIICATCSNSKCRICKKSVRCEGEDCNNIICSDCHFKMRWQKATPCEKLEFHGVDKLKLLAKNKGIRCYSKLSKSDLVQLLKPIVIAMDFPIKKK